VEGRPLNEADLIARARTGDESAYAALVAQTREAALRTASLILGDAAEAEDAVQEATVKAYRALDRFRDGAPFRPWLLQIVANEARNRRRAAGRRAELARRAMDEGHPSGDAAPSPEAAVLAAEQRAVLARAIGDLREEDRQVIAARYYLELSEAETAAALAWPRGTVKSRLSRALGRLRSHAAVGLLALLALVAAVLAGSADVRTAIADRLGLRGVQIGHLPFVPAPTPTTVLLPVGVRFSLGEALTLETARARFGAPVALPAGLGAPDEVYLREPPAGGMVSLVYRPRPGIPPAGSTDVGLLVSQFRGTLAPEFLGKGLGPGSRVEQVTVGAPGGAAGDGSPGAGRGLWIEGQPHIFFYRDRGGLVRDESVRLAGNVLLWERGELTLRLEGALGRDEALAIAASVR
jgi:RNA polymerase sigma-70 factor (ECF subfamily)